MDVSEWDMSSTELSEDEQRRNLHAAFAASFKALEDRAMFKPIHPEEDVYTTGLDVRIEVLFEDAVPIRDGIMAGPALTRRDITEELKK